MPDHPANSSQPWRWLGAFFGLLGWWVVVVGGGSGLERSSLGLGFSFFRAKVRANADVIFIFLVFRSKSMTPNKQHESRPSTRQHHHPDTRSKAAWAEDGREARRTASFPASPHYSS